MLQTFHDFGDAHIWTINKPGFPLLTNRYHLERFVVECYHEKPAHMWSLNREVINCSYINVLAKCITDRKKRHSYYIFLPLNCFQSI